MTSALVTSTATPVTLATTSWGSPSSGRRALLIHGLGSTGALWWQIADSLASDGYHVVAPDLRGHGKSPCTQNYRISEHIVDLNQLGDGWDLVVGHSLGGLLAAAVSCTDGFARRVVLIDPVVEVPDEIREQAIDAQLEANRYPLDAETILAENPRWHRQDAILKAAALASVNLHAVERMMRDNGPWHFSHYVRKIPVPTVILGSDPTVETFFPPALGAQLSAANPNISVQVVPGAGHDIHRDDPAAVLAVL